MRRAEAAPSASFTTVEPLTCHHFRREASDDEEEARGRVEATLIRDFHCRGRCRRYRALLNDEGSR